MNNIVNQFMQNPMKYLSMRYDIPQGLTNPNDIIQHLLNTGQVSQAQVNQYMQLRNNPMLFNQFMKRY